MDAKRILNGLFTGLSIGEALQKADDALDPGVALAAVFSRRFSDASTLGKTLESLIYLWREDFPSLKERETVRFVSGKNRLTGYLYRADLAKGLILYVHGIRGQADDNYAIAQDYFVRHGYDVFAIDLTASGRSEGMGIDGLHQSALDVKAAYEYLLSRGDFENMPIYFFGHSWGGYGVSASLNFAHVRPNAIAELSGFDTPMKEMLGIPRAKLGIPISFRKAELEEALRMRGGEYAMLSGSEGIRKSGVPALAVHGQNDQTVPLSASVIEAVDDREATRLYVPDRAHMDIFFCKDSIVYASMVKAMAKSMTDAYGNDLEKIPQEAMREFLSSFDRRMTSVIDEDTFGAICAHFDAHR